MLRYLSIVIVLVAVLSVLGPRVVGADEAREIYDEFCLSCHGSNGKGDGPAADVLKKTPADFSDCSKMAKVTDEQIINIVTNGGPAEGLSSEMNAWGDRLDPEEIQMLVKLIRGFCVQGTAAGE